MWFFCLEREAFRHRPPETRGPCSPSVVQSSRVAEQVVQRRLQLERQQREMRHRHLPRLVKVHSSPPNAQDQWRMAHRGERYCPQLPQMAVRPCTHSSQPRKRTSPRQDFHAKTSLVFISRAKMRPVGQLEATVEIATRVSQWAPKDCAGAERRSARQTRAKVPHDLSQRF